MQLKSKDYNNLKPCAHQDALQEMRERIAAEANGPSRGKLILYSIDFLRALRNGLSKNSFRVLMSL